MIKPTAFYQAPAESAEIADPDPAPPPPPAEGLGPPLPSDEDLNVAVAAQFPATEDADGMAKKRAAKVKTTTRTLKGQPCPVAGCGTPALGRHVAMHIKRGDLPKGFTLPSSRATNGAAVALAPPVVTPRRGEVVVASGPTSKRIKDLVEEFEKGWKDLEHMRRLVTDIVKLSSDQEATLRLVEGERDELRTLWQGVESQVLARQKGGGEMLSRPKARRR